MLYLGVYDFDDLEEMEKEPINTALEKGGKFYIGNKLNWVCQFREFTNASLGEANALYEIIDYRVYIPGEVPDNGKWAGFGLAIDIYRKLVDTYIRLYGFVIKVLQVYRSAVTLRDHDFTTISALDIVDMAVAIRLVDSFFPDQHLPRYQ